MLKSRVTWRNRLRKKLLNVARVLPAPVRLAIYRRSVRLPYDLPPQLSFKVAETKDEFVQAAKLVHDSYVELGYMSPDESGLRLSVYLALPTTTTLIAKWEDQVIGTMSLVRDSSFGLPMEKVFDLNDLRSSGARLCEVSALAVHPDYIGDKRVSFSMFKFLHQYTKGQSGIDVLVISVHPRAADFYDGVLLFSALHNKVEARSDYVSGSPAVGRYLIFDDFEYSEKLGAVFGNAPRNRNVHSYFFDFDLPNAKIPNSPYYKISRAPWAPQEMNELFNQKANVFARLSSEEIVKLYRIYGKTAFQSTLPHLPRSLSAFVTRRTQRRYFVDCPAEVILNGESIPTDLFNASETGCLLRLTKSQELHGTVTVRAQVGANRIAHLNVEAVRQLPNGLVGCRIHKSSSEWLEFLKCLHQDWYDEDMADTIKRAA